MRKLQDAFRISWGLSQWKAVDPDTQQSLTARGTELLKQPDTNRERAADGPDPGASGGSNLGRLPGEYSKDCYEYLSVKFQLLVQKQDWRSRRAQKPQIRTNVGCFSDIRGTSESLPSAQPEPGAVLAQTLSSLLCLGQLRPQSGSNTLVSFSRMSTVGTDSWFLT